MYVFISINLISSCRYRLSSGRMYVCARCAIHSILNKFIQRTRNNLKPFKSFWQLYVYFEYFNRPCIVCVAKFP